MIEKTFHHGQTPGSNSDNPPSNHTGGHPREMASLYDEIIGVVETMDEKYAPDLKKLRGLRNRYLEGRLHLAVIGQFKRGKSTFLNALIGESLLPSSVLPLTAIPTFIMGGTFLGAEVIGNTGETTIVKKNLALGELMDFLSELVTEAGNPENRFGISQVNVFCPASILRNGVVLVDTPGIGSTFTHNTEMTLNFLPQCDAAIFLISADPPISEVELAFLAQVRQRIPRLFFVLNKVDYLGKKEQEEAMNFFRRILREQAKIEGDISIFPVSAKKGLQAKKNADPNAWTESGMAEVEESLIHFLAEEKAAVLRKALSSKALDIIENILLQIGLTIRSLKMPLHELEQKQRTFEKNIKEGEYQQMAAGDMLKGDRIRLLEFLEKQAEELRQRGDIHFEKIIDSICAGRLEMESLRTALHEDLPLFFERELGVLSRTFERKVVDVLQPHQNRAEHLIESIRKTAAELFQLPYRAIDSTEAFEMKKQPFWVTQHRSTFMNPIPESVLYPFLPSRIRRARIRKKLIEEMESLIFHNVENLRWVTLQNLDQAFRHFAVQLNEQLKSTVEATYGAIQEAQRQRKEKAHAVDSEIVKLESWRVRLQSLSLKL